MKGSKIDKKSIKLVLLLSSLREDLDVHRIIGRNVDALADTPGGHRFWGYLQFLALQRLAISFCKVFEESTNNDLYSIPGIIRTFSGAKLSSQQRVQFLTFGTKYGRSGEVINARAYLSETLNIFSSAHEGALDQLKKFRDTVGAHSDFKGDCDALPSHAEFETLYEFALDFYQLFAEALIGVFPASPPQRVTAPLVEIMKRAGVPSPQVDFDMGE